MKKFVFILVAILTVACLSQKTYAYTFTEHDNALASDSPYSITYSVEEFDSSWNKVVIKLAPLPGYDFDGAYVISIFNLFNDENLAPYDMHIQNGWIGQFPNVIPNYESASRVELYGANDQMKQRFHVAAYPGDPGLVIVRFYNLGPFTATDYFKITIYVDSEVEVNGFINSLLSDSSGKMIRVSSISQAEYSEIYFLGKNAALAEINSEYDFLINQIIELEANIDELEQQLAIAPNETGTVYSTIDFLEDNLIYTILILGAVLLLGVKLGSLKRRRYKSFR